MPNFEVVISLSAGPCISSVFFSSRLPLKFNSLQTRSFEQKSLGPRHPKERSQMRQFITSHSFTLILFVSICRCPETCDRRRFKEPKCPDRFRCYLKLHCQGSLEANNPLDKGQCFISFTVQLQNTCHSRRANQSQPPFYNESTDGRLWKY